MTEDRRTSDALVGITRFGAFLGVVMMLVTIATLLVSLGIFVQQSSETRTTLIKVSAAVGELRDKIVQDNKELTAADMALRERLIRVEQQQQKGVATTATP